MAPLSGPAVVVDSIVKTFKGGVRALDGVTFDIPTGTVLGPGIARTVMGLAGHYAAVDEVLTGMENLVLVGRLNHLPRAQRRARAEELLEQFDLTDAARRPLKTYSGGMRRRLDLAAALVSHPPVLFLDEPTSGLDPRSRSDLWSVIEGLVAGGVTLLLTTQYLEEVDRLADRICVIDHGRVSAEGTAAQSRPSWSVRPSRSSSPMMAPRPKSRPPWPSSVTRNRCSTD
ncbi:MAG: ATP-binding cassette domain-containing protein [Acidimicrobiales bacterium]